MILPERVFGSSSAQMIRFGRANLPIRSATVARISSTSSSLALGVALQGDEGADRLAGVLVGLADHRRLGDLRVGDDRRLDLGGREPVAGDVDDVVDPPDHPEVAVLVLARGVADQVGLLAEAREVGLDEALVLLVEGAQHRGPGPRQDQQALARRSTGSPSLSPTTSASTPGNGVVAEPGLVAVIPGSGVIMIAPVSVCHQVSTIGQRSAADHLVVPEPGLGVDRLADRAEQAQRGEVGLRRGSPPPT